jgi:hypothetical protein
MTNVITGCGVLAGPVPLENRILALTWAFPSSGGSLVLVDQAAQDQSSADLAGAKVGCGDARTGISARDALADALMGTGGVLVLLVLGRYGAQVGLVEDQDLVEELPAQGTDQALADRVHPRSTTGRPRSRKASQRRRYGSAIRYRLFLVSALVDTGLSAAITRLSMRVLRIGDSVPEASGVMPPAALAIAEKVRSPPPMASSTARLELLPTRGAGGGRPARGSLTRRSRRRCTALHDGYD